METKISERKIIIFTAGIIVVAGLVRMLKYALGIVLFYLAFLPYILYRTNYYFKLKGKQKTQIDRYRLIILVSMIITIILNLIGIQDVEFFLLFLLMIDFLLVINKNS
jgi:hypothetical protein